MKLYLKNVVCLCWWLALPSPFVHAETKITFAPGVMNFDYVETSVDGSFLDGEHGDIPGIKLSIEANDDPAFTLGLALEYFAGNVDYDGQIGSFDARYNGLPLSTTTDQKIFSFSTFINQQVVYSPNVFFYGNLTYKKWERDIQATTASGIDNFGDPFTNLYVSGLYEVYKWWQVTLGVLTKIPVFKDTELKLQAGVLRTINPEMDLTFYTFELQEDWGYEGELALFYRVDHWQRVGFSGSIMSWKFGKSDVVAGFFEPDSESEMITIQLIYERDL